MVEKVANTLGVIIAFGTVWFLVSRQSRMRPKDSLLSVRSSVRSFVRPFVTEYLGIPTLVFSDTLQLGRALGM